MLDVEEMNEEVKLVKHHLETLNLLDFKERKRLMKRYLGECSYRQISKETNIPVTTLHGWANERNVYRSEKVLKSMGTVNECLRMAYELLKKVEKVDNVIGQDYIRKIKEELKRIKQEGI